MIKKMISINLCLLLIVLPLLSHSKMKVKPVGPRGDVLEPTPSFRTSYGKGEEEELSTEGAPAAAAAIGFGSGKRKGSSDGGGPQLDMTYQVHILGEVENPGTYRAIASERLSEVLGRAGGIRSTGSERLIELRRQGEKTRNVDLFKYQRRGNLKENPYLMDNDVIYVPLHSKLVQIVGAIKRPDYYELRNERSLGDVVKLAGGLSNSVTKAEPAKVIRYVNGEKTVDDVRMNDISFSSFVVRNGDVIFIPSSITAGREFDYNVASIPGEQVFYPSYDDRVYVLGAVPSSGAYSFNPFFTVSKYIALAGGYTDLASGDIRVTTMKGETIKVSKNQKINPGDTIVVGRRIMRPIEWVSFAMSLSSFGLSTTATVLALTR
jgi:protein involved in polysaccharide export with SLBB domain